MVNQQQIVYSYEDENKQELFRKIREQNPDGSKTFRSEHERDGIMIPNLEGCRRVLYRLPQVLYGISKKQPIFLVEGEKDVETLYRHTIFATTTLSTLEWRDEYTEIVKNADVIILYDNDKAGIQRKNMLLEKLYGKVKSLKVIDLPGLELRDKGGLDVTDWFNMGNSIESFIGLVKKTLPYYPANKLRAITLDELLSIDLPEREMLLEPFLPRQGLAMLVAKRGVGKTHIALGIAYAVATGGSFLRWTAPAAKRVLYIDGEMPAILMQERLKLIANVMDKPIDHDYFKLITPDLQSQIMPDLATPEGRMIIDEFIEDCDLVIIDNISCLFRSSCENEAEGWQQAQEWALDLRRRGKAVLFVHHAGKNGVQRGTSKREDILDTVIILKHPTDYKQDQGARFEVLFDKARDFSGNNATSFEAWLREDSNGILFWELSEISAEARIQQIADLKNNGMTIDAIKKREGLTKSQVETFLKKAKQKGFLIEQ